MTAASNEMALSLWKLGTCTLHSLVILTRHCRVQ